MATNNYWCISFTQTDQLKGDFYAKIWEVAQENNISDEDIVRMIKDHLSSNKKTKRKSRNSKVNLHMVYSRPHHLNLAFLYCWPGSERRCSNRLPEKRGSEKGKTEKNKKRRENKI